MKTKSFTLNSKELLLVELPEGAKDIHLEYNSKLKNHQLFWRAEFMSMPNIGYRRDLPDGEWKLIGKLPEVSEDQYHSIGDYVDPHPYKGDFHYRDFQREGYFRQTAKESFFSALTANGILFRNPLGSHPDNWTYKTEAMHMKNTDIKAWQSAQEKVFNIDNTFLFEKV